MDSAAAYLRISDEIDRACRVARRLPGDVTLVAISKTQPVEAIEPIIGAAQRVLGENRVQEAAS